MLRVGTTIMASGCDGWAAGGLRGVHVGAHAVPFLPTFGNFTIRQPSATPLTGCS